MMKEVLMQDWDGAQHLKKPVTQEQAKGMIPLLIEARQLEFNAVQIIKESLK
jgi:hypothetical protein